MKSVLLRSVIPCLLLVANFGTKAFADDTAVQSVRWTGADDKNASLEHIVAHVDELTGMHLTVADFTLGEDRPLAFNHYKRYDQIVTDVHVKNMAIRVWTAAKTNAVIQVEAQVDSAPAPIGIVDLESASGLERQGEAMTLAHGLIAARGDTELRGLDVERFWQNGHLTFEVTAKAHRGVHQITFDALTLEVVSQTYKLYPHGDFGGQGKGETSIPALVFPIYEEYMGQLLERKKVELMYLKTEIALPASDPFASLRDRHYYSKMEDSVLGNTAEGQAQGYWSMAWLRGQVTALQAGIPLVRNDFDKGGARLVGRYATINIYPEAFTAFPGVTLPQVQSSQAMYNWQEDVVVDDWQVIPGAAMLGKTLDNREAALNRDATRDPQHNAALYINNGFDEVQVYYAINQLFDSLRPLGFIDSDLAERPFHAFLFDPSIEDQDNAFYTDDTINFTTYTPNQLNMARDNTTIWHELGHGVMDRLMGSKLNLADTGGLSEGMADYVAEMVLQAATGGVDFPGINDQRIINRTGFFLTNEVHDDGEAYGGTMKDILDLTIAKYGRGGLHKIVDLVLETMRLCRDHPALTADAWFDHMKFADKLGRKGVHSPNELTPLIIQALGTRNFASEAERGSFSLQHDGQEIVAGSLGSRGNEVPLTLAPDATTEQHLLVTLKDGTAFHYDFPVEVRIFYNSGPLQGAIDWIGEDQEPEVHVLNSIDETLTLNIKAKGTCDAINRDDGSCSDFAYVQIWNHDAAKPVAKKRFYLRIKNP